MPEAGPNALDAGQYSRDAIRKYEAIYGRNFISPGGVATTQAILAMVDFAPAMQVLDVGCGLGGAAFLMAQRFGARVHGVDLSHNMLAIAQERCREAQLTHAVDFEHADILRFDRPGAYDLVHSRDAFLHIHDKPRLLAVLHTCLRRNGWLLFSDYLGRAGAHSSDFAAYIHARDYDLRSLEEYHALIEQAGFTVLRAEDRTGDFIAIMERELDQLAASELPAHEQAELAQSWQAKLRRARSGEQRWGVFLAQRPGDDDTTTRG